MQLDLNPKRLLMRLENQFASGEDSMMSKNVTVDIKSAFSSLSYAHDAARLQWESVDGPSANPDWTVDGFSVTLDPMEIKTIELEID